MEINDLIIADMVQAEVDRVFPADVAGVQAVMRHAVLPFGKMLGPRLVIRSALSVGGSLQQALPAAVGVEFVQVGAMIHDDIIDGDGLRRGRDAPHAAFGRDQAIIAGDSLFFAGVGALARCEDQDVGVGRVNRAVRGLVHGSLLIGEGAADELALARRVCAISDYLSMIAKKSGSWLWMACHVGAVLGGGDESEIEALGSYGRLLGTGYQIRDDLMTFDGTVAGKPHLSDVRNGRPTLPILVAYQRSGPAQRAVIEALLAGADAASVAERYAAMAALVETTEAVQRSQDLARRYAAQAQEALMTLTRTEHRDALHDLTEPGRLI